MGEFIEKIFTVVLVRTFLQEPLGFLVLLVIVIILGALAKALLGK